MTARGKRWRQSIESKVQRATDNVDLRAVTVIYVSPLGSAANYVMIWRCDNSICIPVICVPPYTYHLQYA